MDKVQAVALEELATLVQRTLCLTDEHDRDGSREVPLWDNWPEIQNAIETAIGLAPDTLLHYGTRGKCKESECSYCSEEPGE